MLDKDTKKRIDDLRQTLVGKVPDPKAQVEQITFALIYKFMDDMDNESLKMGGVPSYFIGEYEKYSWKNLFDTKLGGQDLVLLYNEGITKMNNNPNLSSVFRDIFKNAGINYRDPETLRLFLKKINEFEYTNSEKLGDAYEYLLSVLGSQGNAGQFRTPRNIIEFIIKILNPQKNETILDPACGTSGFLISSYKHILQTNKNNLKPDERNQIIENIYGYDLDPEMVRMSLVNMYLHNFTDPKIFEYDTLTSEEKWGDYFDVILANPPFMTPKGGIRPHKRFSINSSRSEILFIDYIQEHLTPNGRAGVIVPAGIIFDEDSAYVNIRKKLIKDSLVGIISLPKGVFLPYSAVKTSILILDKKLSKERNHIFYINIENDGYSLNNNRKPIKDNDLPIALENLANNNYFKVLKKEILNKENISFVYTDYIKEKKLQNQKYTKEKLSNLVEIFSGSRQKGGSLEDGIPSIGGAQIGKYGEILQDKMVYISEEHFNKMNKGQLKKGDVLIVKDGATTGKIGLYKGEFTKAAINEHVFGLRVNNKILDKFLYFLMMGQTFQAKVKPMIQGIIGGINLKFSNLEIPLPSIEKQFEIVNELNSYEKIIEGSRQIILNYAPVLEQEKDWQTVELGDVTELIKRGITPKYTESNGTTVLNQKCIRGNSISYELSRKHDHHEKKIASEKYLQNGDVLVNSTGVGTLGRVAQFFGENNKNTVDSHITIVRPNKKIFEDYFFGLSMIMVEKIISKSGEGSTGQTELSRDRLSKIKISFPKSFEEQKMISDKIRLERNYINNNMSLIETFSKKIENKVNKIWSD